MSFERVVLIVLIITNMDTESLTRYLIVGDIGGTNCRLELLKLLVTQGKSMKTESILTAKYHT